MFASCFPLLAEPRVVFQISLKLADPDADVFILNDTVQKLQILLQKKRVVFVRGGVAFVTIPMFLCLALWVSQCRYHTIGHGSSLHDRSRRMVWV